MVTVSATWENDVIAIVKTSLHNTKAAEGGSIYLTFYDFNGMFLELRIIVCKIEAWCQAVV